MICYLVAFCHLQAMRVPNQKNEETRAPIDETRSDDDDDDDERTRPDQNDPGYEDDSLFACLHACFAVCISLVSLWGLIFLPFLLANYLQCRYFVWRRGTPISFLIMRGSIFFLDFLMNSSSQILTFLEVTVSPSCLPATANCNHYSAALVTDSDKPQNDNMLTTTGNVSRMRCHVVPMWSRRNQGHGVISLALVLDVGRNKERKSFKL